MKKVLEIVVELNATPQNRLVSEDYSHSSDCENLMSSLI